MNQNIGKSSSLNEEYSSIQSSKEGMNQNIVKRSSSKYGPTDAKKKLEKLKELRRLRREVL